jgi:hypothetical protein
MGEWRYSSSFFTLALGGSEWSASCPREIDPIANWIGGKVYPKTSPDTEEEKNLVSAGN